MTDQAIVTWDPNSGAALPAYLTGFGEELGSNIADRQTVPSLSYEGKTWTIVKDGNKTKMQAQNTDGDMVPIPIMRVVILDFNGERGRAFYPGVYNPAESKQPDCWSPDGVAPDPGALKKQSTSCKGCPMSIKGSKVQDGKEMVACSTHRMLALAPAFDIPGDPLRLKIAVTSDWDKEVVEHGWFAFRQYTDFLKARSIVHTAMVVTKIKFDPNTAYPKLLFSLDRLLDQNEAAQAALAVKNPKVQELLNEKWSAAGTAGQLTDQSDTRPHGLEGAVLDGWAVHPDSAGYFYKGGEVKKSEDVAALYPEPAPPPLPVEAAVEPTPTPTPPASTQTITVEATVVDPKPVLGGLAAATADGWAPHPGAPGYHYKGTDVKLDAEVEALYPSAPAVVAAAPPPPPPAPEPEVVAVDPMAAALADGWTKHPDGDWLYKGSDVVVTANVLSKYAGNATASAPAAPASESSAAATSTTTSPSSPAPTGTGEVSAEVAALLGKWGQS